MPRKSAADATEPQQRSITLKSITFSEIKFRKLGSITFDIAPRVTLVAGRNGVGKSTILALVANASGLTRGKDHTTYFGRLPQAKFEEIIRLSIARDFIRDDALKPNVTLEYEANGQAFHKRCNVTARANEGLRIVPRNEPKGPKVVGGIKVPADGKVPIPTIYLGMMRMLPIGETDPAALQTSIADASEEDKRFLESFIKKIIATGTSLVETSPEVSTQAVKGTTKISLHPPYNGYDSTAVSLGQDSLSAIATALVSFQKLQREMPDYPGGIFVIDEIDAGFHPQAQVKLFEELKKEARRLNLQIVATTHSLTMLAEAHRSITAVPKNAQRQDAIVYLQGGNPVELLEWSRYEDIEDDMFLRLHDEPKQPVAKVYVEDDEAALFLNAILKPRKRAIEAATGRKIEVLSTHLGCTNLMQLHKADSYFRTVVIVLDADTTTGSRVPSSVNIVRLPTDPLREQKQSPEVILEAMCRSLISETTTYPQMRNSLRKQKHSTDHVEQKIIALQDNETADQQVAADRDFAKKWFTRRVLAIKTLKLIEGWVADNASGVEQFIAAFTAAVNSVAIPAPVPQKRLANRASAG